MAHLQPAPTSFNYFDPPPQQQQQQPLHYSFQQQQQPMQQHQQLQQQQLLHQQQQQRNGGSAHYALVQQQQQQQLLGHHSTSTPGQSPYRHQSQPSSLPHSQHASPLMAHPQMAQQPQPQQPHAQPQPHPHQHPTRPMSGNFKRELFPHEMQQPNQQQFGAAASGPSGLMQQRAGPFGHGPPSSLSSKDSPPPNLDEYKLMEQNVRSITESPPPDQVANMLSQILAPNVANKFGQFAPPPQQSQSHQQQQQQTHQQQLYAHFGYGGPAQQAPKQQAFNYASPAASIQLSQHQAQLAQSNHFSRPPVQPSMQPHQQQPQPSYYDQQAPPQQQQHNGLGGGGGMSPYVPLQYPSAASKNGPPAQLSPSQIPGMANIVDPDYVRMLRERQRELHELQRNEANRAQMAKEQQIRMQQQQLQQQQQLPMGLGLGHFQQPPPPLQVRSQSLPDQFGNANASHAQSTPPNYYSQPDANANPMALHQQQYRMDLASSPLGQQQQQQQQLPGSYPHSLMQQQAQIGAYTNQLHANSNQPAGVAVPPGFKADGSAPASNNSPPFATRQQSQQQSLQQQQQPSQYSQMQQLKQIVNSADGEFRAGAASPNLNSGPSARVPSAPLPRRSQSLGDPNGNGLGMGVGAQPSPVSHEAVPISLGGRRGGGEGGERAAVGANLSRFACGPPHQESRGFVARCCTEARRGRASHAAPSSSSSVLTRASFGTRRSSKDMSLPSRDSAGGGVVSSSHATLALYNPFSGLASSPELPDSSPTAPTPTSSYQSYKPAPLSTASPAASAHATPCASPNRHPAPRARMHTPLLPPTPK